MQSVSSDKNQGKMMRPAFYAVVALVGAVVVTMGVSRLKSALPMVDRSAIQIVTVRRGPVTRKVQGLGVLVPMTTRLQLEKEELTIADEAGRAQLAAKQAEVAQVRARYALKMQQKEALQVHAGIAGALEEVTVDARQQVAPGKSGENKQFGAADGAPSRSRIAVAGPSTKSESAD